MAVQYLEVQVLKSQVWNDNGANQWRFQQQEIWGELCLVLDFKHRT